MLLGSSGDLPDFFSRALFVALLEVPGSSTGLGGGGPLSRLACIFASIEISDALLRCTPRLSASLVVWTGDGTEPELGGSSESRDFDAW